ncbi:GntR family transcriptional regulator [Kribbella pittospori]|uniref:GntR family transcriptional regulator n=1 Tax=Kribbella pittospori TaxID=722689 RepID=A0A4V2M7Q5_9ACTN|nr:GntR family transcriptional regulator [Kribbella pittospori]
MRECRHGSASGSGGGGELAEQIQAQLPDRISSGVLPAGTMLPSCRELAARLAVSRTTVVAAYERLAVHGMIRSRAGAATFVTGRPAFAAVMPVASPLRPLAIWHTEQLAVPDLTVPSPSSVSRPAYRRARSSRSHDGGRSTISFAPAPRSATPIQRAGLDCVMRSRGTWPSVAVSGLSPSNW